MGICGANSTLHPKEPHPRSSNNTAAPAQSSIHKAESIQLNFPKQCCIHRATSTILIYQGCTIKPHALSCIPTGCTHRSFADKNSDVSRVCRTRTFCLKRSRLYSTEQHAQSWTYRASFTKAASAKLHLPGCILKGCLYQNRAHPRRSVAKAKNHLRIVQCSAELHCKAERQVPSGPYQASFTRVAAVKQHPLGCILHRLPLPAFHQSEEQHRKGQQPPLPELHSSREYRQS